MRHLIVLASFAIAAACAPSPASAPIGPASAAPAGATTPATAPDQAATPAPVAAPIADEAGCKTAGGDWRPICRMQKPACVITYKDAGKSCTDGSQCEGGRCLAETTTATPGVAATGKCAANSDPCGCSTSIVDGKTSATLCAD